MTPLEAQEYLNSFINYEYNIHYLKPSDIKLERVRELLKLLGNPQSNFKSIHVAGSKGKGSTCAMAANILKVAGKRVGLYTSPHIYQVRERIRILEKNKDIQNSDLFPDCISGGDFALCLDEMKPAIEKIRAKKEYGKLSYFEILTALAFYYFSRQRIDVAVIEAGLGGRLDATNTVCAQVCAITSISLEHTQQLGNTLESIAREKIAIVKQSHQKAIIAPQTDEVRQVITEYCRKIGAEVSFMDDEDVSSVQANLLGAHQSINAAMSAKLAECMATLSDDIIRKGITKTFWPGRFEIIQKQPTVILDCAHNANSAAQCVQTMKEIMGDAKVMMVLGVSDDKDIKGIIEQFKKISHQFILTKAVHPRAFDFNEKADEYFEDCDVMIKNSVQDAVALALEKANEKDTILISGSLFVVAEARKALEEGMAKCIS